MEEVINEQDQVVTMNIPVDQPVPDTSGVVPETIDQSGTQVQEPQVTPEASIPVTQPIDPQPPVEHIEAPPTDLSTSSPQSQSTDAYCSQCGSHAIPSHNKGCPVMGGRPCRYCENKEAYDKITMAFVDRCVQGVNGKPIMPYLEELAIELDCDEDTISLWANKKTKNTEELEHPVFFGAYIKIKNYQRLRLKQRVMGRFNPTGAIFLLKANHGLIETEKRVLAGDSNEPLQIEIIEEKHE